MSHFILKALLFQILNILTHCPEFIYHLVEEGNKHVIQLWLVVVALYGTSSSDNLYDFLYIKPYLNIDFVCGVLTVILS